MPLTDFSKQALLDHFAGTAYVPANTQVWLTQFTSSVNLTIGSLVNEVTDMGRAVLPFGASSAITERTVFNSADVTLTPTSGGDSVTHWGVIDAAAAGNLLAFGSLDEAYVSVGQVKRRFFTQSLSITIDDPSLVCLSKYFIDGFLGFMFSDPSTPFASPSARYAALHDQTSTDGTAGEFAGGPYARQLMSFGAFALNGLWGRIETDDHLTWTGQTQTPAAQVSVFDAVTAGNFLAFDDAVDLVVPSGRDVQILSGDFAIEVL